MTPRFTCAAGCRNRWRSARCGLVALLLTWPAVAQAGFTVRGGEILHDGAPFQVRGVCYQPTPIGANPAVDAPRGDYFTSEYGEIAQRDLPKIRALGANVVRVYNWALARDHRAFLDACFNGGEDPLYVLVNRWIEPDLRWSDPETLARLRQEFLELDAGLGQHPAVLGVVLGNEINARHGNGDNPAFWHAMNAIASDIKRQSPARLVSMAVTDAMPQIAAWEGAVTALDFWCIQSYRGTSFASFFDEYARASTRPLVVTEFGIDAYDHRAGGPYDDNGRYVATVLAALWGEIAANGAVCAGGCVFEFADEWWKARPGRPDVQDTGGIPLASLPDGYANEEWWGLHAVRPGAGVDELVPRRSLEALKQAWGAGARPEARAGP